MFPYFFVFAICLLLSWKSNERNRIPVCLICIILSIMAGLRDLHVGTDTESYYNEFLYMSSSYKTVDDFLNDDMGFDLGFLILNWFIGKISKGSFHFLFIVQLITTGFLYAGYVRLSKHFKASLFSFTAFYLFLVYNYSFNALRQECAISIVFYAFSCLWDKKYMQYIVWTLLAFTLHSSALVSFLIGIVYYIVFIENPKVRKIAIIILVSGVLIAFMSFFLLLEVVGGLNFFNEALLARYGTESMFDSTSRIGIIPTVLVFFAYSLIYWGYKKKVIGNHALLFHLIMNTMYFMTLFLSLYNVYLYRLGLYFYVVNLYYMSVEMNSRSVNHFLKVSIVFYVFLTWVYQYLLSNMSETVPYTSKILGI